MSDALERAKEARRHLVDGTRIVIPLSLLESLIDEIERLGRVGNVKDIVMNRTDIRA